MFNPNYVGSYAAMLVILPLGIYLNLKDRKKIFALGSLSVLMFAYLLGSKSRAGMVGFIIGFLILAFLLHRVIQRHWKRTAVILLAFLIVFISMDVYTVDDIFDDIFFPATEPELIEEEIVVPPLRGVFSENNTLTIETDEVALNIVKGEGNIGFFDDAGNELDYIMEQDTGRMLLTAEGYQEHSIKMDDPDRMIFWQAEDEADIITWEYDSYQASFKYYDEEFFMLGMRNNFYPIQEVDYWGFEGYERLGSSRGYIWSRSLPLLRETLLLGHGPDTYAFYFPQEDVVGKLKFLSSPRTMVDKPHNLYLQTAINTGVVSLLALIVLWGAYLLQGLKLYWKADFTGWQTKIGVAVMAAVAAYLATGFFNDSVISVAPVFWILLGIGISMNLRIKSSRS